MCTALCEFSLIKQADTVYHLIYLLINKFTRPRLRFIGWTRLSQLCNAHAYVGINPSASSNRQHRQD